MRIVLFSLNDLFFLLVLILDAPILRLPQSSMPEPIARVPKVEQQMLECRTWSPEQISNWLCDSGLDQYHDRLARYPFSMR